VYQIKKKIEMVGKTLDICNFFVVRKRVSN
jgi:hypothetical protein